MHSGQSLKAYLEENCVKTKFTRFDYKSKEKFNIELKCEVEKDQSPEFYSEYANSWVKKFSKFTSTTWIVRQCFPKLKRLLYRKTFHCHRSSFNKKKKLDFDSRNQDCKANIEFRMKFINRNTIKNDPLLKEGLNLTISIDFNHSHKVRTLEAFNMLKSTSETDELFNGYFDNGCTPGAAKCYHELTLIDKHGDDVEILSNATINPTLRHLFYLHTKRKKEGVKTPSVQEMMDMKRSVLEPCGFTLGYKEPLMVIVTPMMKRVIAEIGLEYVLIDSTNVTGGPICTIFYVPTKIGAIPFAFTIDTDSDESFANALFSVKLAVETETGAKFEPKIVMLSHIKKQCVSHLIPNSKLMSSRHSICSEVWAWLFDDDNKIERKKRHILMITIKSLLYSTENAENVYTSKEMRENKSISMKLKEYIDDLWETREDWMISEDNILANPLVELSIRLMKEFIQQKCKNFNSCILVDTVTTVLENHQRRIIHSYLNRKDTAANYTRYLTKAKIVLGFGSDVRRISANEFRIDLQQRPKKYLHFRTDTMFCDCLYGKKGHFCEHLCAIINIIDTDVMKIPALSEEEVLNLTKVAGSEIKEDIKIIKPEIDEEMELFEENNDHEEIENETDNLDDQSTSEVNDDYFYLDVKKEKNFRCDPLEAESDHNSDNNYQIIEEPELPTTSNQAIDIQKSYEVALKAVNDEFRRLNKFFSGNPNTSNLETMRRLTRELSKIRPVERVNLENMHIELNDTAKGRRT